MPAIHYLKRSDIDTRKWNQCIDQSSNGLIYAYSYYLDALCDHWDGLILDDYKAVMPLPWRKKFGIYYLYQPFLVAQLGLFGETITSTLLELFLKSIPQKFKYWDYTLNRGNVFRLQQYFLYERKNYILNLNTTYDQLYKSYRGNTRRTIKKAIEDYKCIVHTDIDIDQVMTFAKQQKNNTGSHEDFERFKKLYHFLHSQQKAVTYGVFSPDHELIASSVFLFSHERAYYILAGNHPNGRTLGASPLVIDTFIRNHAGKNLLLDFEGSDIPNIAFFFSSFGANEEKYTAVRLNKLPKYLQWLKR